MKKYILLLILFAGSFCNAWAVGPGPDKNGILYVDSSATGPLFGTSWPFAMKSLSDALIYATQHPGTVKQIWVAKGTYYPLYLPDAVDGESTDTTNRYNTFLLIKDIKIYGGFAGTETDTASRDLKNPANRTTLSGDIGVKGDNTDNAYHVMVAAGDMGSALLSGVTISDGNSNNSDIYSSTDQVINNYPILPASGGGMYLGNASLLIEDTHFINNYGSFGSAIYSEMSDLNKITTFRRTVFAGNEAAYATIYSNSTNVDIDDSRFISNNGGSMGGAIYLNNGILNCRNSSFNDNKAVTASVFYLSSLLQSHITNCEFLRDTASARYLIMIQASDALLAENVKISGCSVTQETLLNISSGSSFTFINAQITGNNIYNSGSLFTANLGSVNNIINSTISGNNASVFTGDNGEALNIQNSIISGNKGGFSMGSGSLNIQYSTGDNLTADEANHVTVADPLFDNAPSYHLAPFTNGVYTLQPGSTALNAGSDALYNAQPNAPQTDVAGNPRFRSVIDQGAYEMRFAQTIAAQSDTAAVYGTSVTLPFASSSGLAVLLSSADTTIATVYPAAADSSTWKIDTKNAGTIVITASQPGNDSYLPALNVPFTFTVNKAALTITANDTARCYNTANPLFSSSYSGWVYNETPAVLSAAPSAATTATASSAAGNYDIITSGAAAANYIISYQKGTLTVYPSPESVLTASGSTAVCSGDSVALQVSGNYTFQWLLNGSEVKDSTAAVFQTATPGIYSVSVTGENGCTAMAADSIAVTIHPLPVSILTTAGDTAVCNGASVALQASGNYTFQWLLNGSEVKGSAAGSIQAATPGTYTASATDENGCTAPVADSITITIYPSPVSALTTSGNTVVCNGDSVALQASGNYTFQWLLNGNQVNGSTAGIFQAVTPGTYTVTATSENNCTAMAAGTITVTAGKLPGIQLPEVTTGANMPVALQARDMSGTAYEWTPATGLSDASFENPVATLSQNQLYEIQMTLPDGCIITDTLKVSVFITNEMLVPNVFTPNGDGQNDVLLINLRGIKQLHKFSIFNRWGKKLFETSDPAQGWDGRYNGELQPLATYIWTAEGVGPSGNTIHNQGSVTLLR